MAEATFANRTGYTWSERAQQYRGSDGRFVPRDLVRQALDSVVQASSQEVRRLSESLQTGRLSVADWQVQMAREIKTLHLAAAASARGGWAQMAPSDLGWTGQRIRADYAYLREFAREVASGRQPPDGRLLNRADLYAQSARVTARRMETRLALRTGPAQARRRLAAADHCATCLSEAARGWQPAGTLRAIGDTQCRVRDRCTIEYRASAA